jgi:hypothetical protein
MSTWCSQFLPSTHDEIRFHNQSLALADAKPAINQKSQRRTTSPTARTHDTSEKTADEAERYPVDVRPLHAVKIVSRGNEVGPLDAGGKQAIILCATSDSRSERGQWKKGKRKTHIHIQIYTCVEHTHTYTRTRTSAHLRADKRNKPGPPNASHSSAPVLANYSGWAGRNRWW